MRDRERGKTLRQERSEGGKRHTSNKGISQERGQEGEELKQEKLENKNSPHLQHTEEEEEEEEETLLPSEVGNRMWVRECDPHGLQSTSRQPQLIKRGKKLEAVINSAKRAT